MTEEQRLAFEEVLDDLDRPENLARVHPGEEQIIFLGGWIAGRDTRNMILRNTEVLTAERDELRRELDALQRLHRGGTPAWIKVLPGDEHPYRSTACLHELHERCRKTCKFCEVLCLCACHATDVAKPSANVLVNRAKVAELCSRVLVGKAGINRKTLDMARELRKLAIGRFLSESVAR